MLTNTLKCLYLVKKIRSHCFFRGGLMGYFCCVAHCLQMVESFFPKLFELFLPNEDVCQSTNLIFQYVRNLKKKHKRVVNFRLTPSFWEKRTQQIF